MHAGQVWVSLRHLYKTQMSSCFCQCQTTHISPQTVWRKIWRNFVLCPAPTATQFSDNLSPTCEPRAKWKPNMPYLQKAEPANIWVSVCPRVGAFYEVMLIGYREQVLLLHTSSTVCVISQASWTCAEVRNRRTRCTDTDFMLKVTIPASSYIAYKSMFRNTLRRSMFWK